MRFKNKRAQSILEYAMVLAGITVVIVGTQIYVKRAMQGRFKQSADQIGEQFTTAENYTIETISQSARQEKTLTGLTGTAWTESKILSSTELAPNEKKLDYPGYELSKTDYVTGVSGSDAAADLGRHSGFDSGQISKKGLFEDD